MVLNNWIGIQCFSIFLSYWKFRGGVSMLCSSLNSSFGVRLILQFQCLVPQHDMQFFCCLVYGFIHVHCYLSRLVGYNIKDSLANMWSLGFDPATLSCWCSTWSSNPFHEHEFYCGLLLSSVRSAHCSSFSVLVSLLALIHLSNIWKLSARAFVLIGLKMLLLPKLQHRFS